MFVGVPVVYLMHDGIGFGVCVKRNQSVGTKLLLKAVEIRLKCGKSVTERRSRV